MKNYLVLSSHSYKNLTICSITSRYNVLICASTQCHFSIDILSQRSPLVCGVYFTSMAVFLLQLFFYHFFGVGLPAYFSNHSPFLREHIFVSFNEFPSLMFWCTVIHHHRPQGPTLFQREMGFYVCAV